MRQQFSGDWAPGPVAGRATLTGHSEDWSRRRTMTSTWAKPITNRDARQYVRAASRRIAAYELRYEVSTSQMREMVRSGAYRETAEIAKWLQDANIVEHLSGLVGEKSTAGSGSTVTRPSTKAHSNGTPSS